MCSCYTDEDDYTFLQHSQARRVSFQVVESAAISICNRNIEKAFSLIFFFPQDERQAKVVL